MTDNIIKLPTAATSYYTVNKQGRFFKVMLVTPLPGGKPIKTVLYGSCDRQTAIEYGRQTAERMNRPFKMPRGTK